MHRDFVIPISSTDGIGITGTLIEQYPATTKVYDICMFVKYSLKKYLEKVGDNFRIKFFHRLIRFRAHGASQIHETLNVAEVFRPPSM